MITKLKYYFPVIILFLFFASLYIYTSAPGVYDGDSGELSAAVNTLGLAHPTGFPLYMILGKVFTLLVPVGDIAYRLNIFSALLTATSLIFIYYILRNLGRSTFASLSAAFVLGLGRNTIWGNSGRAGIYPLSLLLVATLFYIFSKWKLKPDTKYLYLYGFLWGLSLGTHALMAIMGIPFLFMLWKSWPFLKSHISILIKTIIVTIAPGVQYIYLLFAYRRNGIITWGSMNSFHDFIYYITQRQYASKFLANDFSNFFSKLGGLLIGEFTIIFFLVAIIGFITLYKKGRVLPNLLILTLFLNIGMMYVYGKNQDDLKILYRYLFIADFVLVIATAYGLDGIIEMMRTIKNHKRIVAIIAVIFLLIQFRYSYRDNNRRNNFLIEDTAHNALNTMEPNSVLFGLGDHIMGPLWYSQSIGEREDVAIVSTALLSYDWYVSNLVKKYPDIIGSDILAIPSGENRIVSLIEKNYTKRPVYSIQFNSLANNQEFEFIPQGILFRIVPRGSPSIKEMAVSNKIIWDNYTLRNVKPSFYSDQMLKDLTIYYGASLYLAGVESFKNSLINESIDFLQRSLDVYPTTDTQKNLDLLKSYKAR